MELTQLEASRWAKIIFSVKMNVAKVFLFVLSPLPLRAVLWKALEGGEIRYSIESMESAIDSKTKREVN